MAERIRIEGPPEVLEEVRQELVEELGESIEIQPLTTAVPGELREPMLVALLVSTGAVAIRTGGSVAKRVMTHLERRQALQIFREKDDQEIPISELFKLLSDD